MPILATSATESVAADDLRDELQSVPHRILFEAYENDNWDLFVMNADGSERRNLTKTSGIHELYPQASTDGRSICFLVDMQAGGRTQRSVWVMNADGSDREKVADNARQPCWSPNSRTIACVPQEFKRFRVDDYVSKGLVFYDLSTREHRKHSNEAIHHLYGLTWSAGGDWIVSTVHGGMGYGHAIIAINIGNDAVHDLEISGCRPCLSPDGTKITWSRDDHTICAADVTISQGGAEVSNTVVVAHDDKLHLYHPDFSPDGKYITYSMGPGGRVRANGPGTHTQVAEMVGVRGDWNLYVKRASGEGEALRLTEDSSLSSKESEWIRTPALTP